MEVIQEKKVVALCRVCKSSDVGRAFPVRNTRSNVEEFYNYVTCSHCGSLSIVEVPKDLSTLYSKYYSFQGENKSSAFVAKIRSIVLRVCFFHLPCRISYPLAGYFFDGEDDFKVNSVLYLSPKKSWTILDVGSGNGDFVKQLFGLGFSKTVGIDPFLASTIEHKNGAKIIKCSLIDMNGKYDLITYHHSFEHLLKPEEELKRIKALLKPKGICVLRIPNIDCLSFRWFKSNWVGLHAPYHIFLPSRQGMESLLAACGLKINECKGEQVIDFFLISQENYMGFTDNQPDAIRNIIKTKGKAKYSPWHCKMELSFWKSMKKLVKKNQSCDCVAYYVTHA